MSPLERFAWFMRERYEIFLLRKAGCPPPWTEDEVLRTYRFCNVFREDDRTTVWIRENIREPYADHPLLWMMLAIARWVNRIESLEFLVSTDGWPRDKSWRPRHLTHALYARAARGPVYTGAYMLRAETDPASPAWGNKHRYIAEIVVGNLWKHRSELTPLFESARTLELAWRNVALDPRFSGWGPFMTYELVTDLRHTRYLRKATDVFTWANAGPGALRGLNRLHGWPLRAKVADPVGEMRALWEWLVRPGEVEAPWPRGWPALEMREVEHTLCEFDKYERARLGEGAPRQLFHEAKAGPLP